MGKQSDQFEKDSLAAKRRASKAAKVFFAILALELFGCASPRTFDPNEGGQSYSSTAYQSYQSCLDALTPLGQGFACAGTGGIGGSSSSSSSSSTFTNPNGTLPYGNGAGTPTFTAVHASPEAFAAEFERWPAEEQQAQVERWNQLADDARATTATL